MTLDQRLERDRRIAALEALGRARSISEQRELGRLVAARDQQWRRLATAHAVAVRRVREIEAYAATIRMPLGDAA